MPLYKPQGVALPDLTNPATAENIQKGFEAITEDGSIVTGTHTEADSPTLPALSKPAAAAQILADYDAINADGNRVAGSMPNNGAVKIELNAGGSVAIAAGYHNGGGYASAKSLAAQTVGDAVAGDIANGKKAWVNGAQVTGTHVDKTLAEQTPGTAAAGDIASGKSAWVNGEQVTGNYVAPAPGYQYEEVTVAAKTTGTKTYTVTTSLDSITTFSGGANSGWLMSGQGYMPMIAIQPDTMWNCSWDGQYGVSITKYNTNVTMSTSGGTLSITTKTAQNYAAMKFLFVGN